MLNIAYRKINIKTLDKGVNNDYWEILASKGSLRIGKEKSWHGSIVAAFLAGLPFVDYTLRPRTLYLRK